MPWFRLDDDFGNHPKALKAGLDGVGLFVTCGTHCARYLTNGFVDTATARSRAPQSLIDKVTRSGLWVKVDGGYLIEDYLEYNPSRDQVLAERARAAERQQRARDRATAKRHGVSHGVTSGEVLPSSQAPRTRTRIDAAAAASTAGGSGTDLSVDISILRAKMAAFTALSALRWDLRPEVLEQISALIELHGDERLVDVAVRTCRNPPPISASAFVGTWLAMPAPGRTVQIVEAERCPVCSMTVDACEAANQKLNPEDRCTGRQTA